jgi:hypothetical protein
MGSAFQNHEQNLIAIRDTVTSVEIDDAEVLSYILEQNFPNPFNSTTYISFSIPVSGNVTLKVFDLLGNEVTTLVNRYQERGEYNVILQADNFASGIYFYPLTSGSFTASKKLILMK